MLVTHPKTCALDLGSLSAELDEWEGPEDRIGGPPDARLAALLLPKSADALAAANTLKCGPATSLRDLSVRCALDREDGRGRVGPC